MCVCEAGGCVCVHVRLESIEVCMFERMSASMGVSECVSAWVHINGVCISVEG